MDEFHLSDDLKPLIPSTIDMSMPNARFLYAILTIAVFSSHTVAADISGTVTDYATGQPLDGVRVSLSIGGVKKFGPIATMKGKYKFENVPNGKYTLTFDFTGYQPRPDDHDCMVPLPGGPQAIDTQLLKEETAAATSEYYRKLGQIFAQLVKEDGAKDRDYQYRWAQLRRFRLPPVGKLEIVKSIDGNDKKARDILPLDQYLRSEVATIESTSESFRAALVKGDVPPKSSFNAAGDELIADALLYELRTSTIPQEAKDKFLQVFLKSWEGSKAVTLVRSASGRQPLKK